MIAVIYGPDAASARAQVGALVRTHDPAGDNTSRLDGRTVSVAEVIAAIASVGFFGQRRVVIVSDLLARAAKPGRRSGNAAEDEDEAPAAGGLDLAPLLAAVPPDNVLILVDTEVMSIPAAVKRALPEDATVIAVEPPRGHELIAWLIQRANAADADLDRKTAQAIAERLYPQTWSTKPSNPRFDRPPDLDLLGNEVDKLALAAHPGPITRRHVDALVPAGDDDRVFRFLSAAANGELSAALGELERLQAAGEAPHKLAAQLYQQIELAAVLDAAGGRTDPLAVGRALGLANPNRMVGIAASTRGQRPGARTEALASAALVDRQTKSGALRQPDDAVYHLMTQAAGSKGPAKAPRRGGK